MREIDRLIEALAAAVPSEPTLFNQYACAQPGLDRPDAAAIRCANLRARLLDARRHPPPALVIGEAAGYRGCRFSGLPFTSEFTALTNPQLRPLNLRPSSLRSAPWKEPSSTIVWEAFSELCASRGTPPPLLWAVVPFHPHLPGKPLSNRAPTRTEELAGVPFFRTLRAWFPRLPLIAAGRVAERMLSALGESFTPVRHPSHGGKAQFRQGLFAVLGERSVSARKAVRA